MTILVVFLAGFAFGAIFVGGLLRERRQPRWAPPPSTTYVYPLTFASGSAAETEVAGFGSPKPTLHVVHPGDEITPPVPIVALRSDPANTLIADRRPDREDGHA